MQCERNMVQHISVGNFLRIFAVHGDFLARILQAKYWNRHPTPL